MEKLEREDNKLFKSGRRNVRPEKKANSKIERSALRDILVVVRYKLPDKPHGEQVRHRGTRGPANETPTLAMSGLGARDQHGRNWSRTPRCNRLEGGRERGVCICVCVCENTKICTNVFF